MRTNQKVYLDYAATTPLDPQVLEGMLPYFRQDFGNPSSIHRYGQRAEAAVIRSREQISEVLRCHPDEILFTSCGTESDNLALRGAALAGRESRGANHILITPVEHHAVTTTAEHLSEIHGFEVETIPVDRHGLVDPGLLKDLIRQDTAIVSVIYANNEIGSINPLPEIGAICQDRGVAFHTDAVQAGAHLSLDVNHLNVDLMAIGAHKFYGPKGVGVLYRRRNIPLEPILTGGGQEFGLRAGTHNVPYIVGMATALSLAQSKREERADLYIPLRDRIIGGILDSIPDSQLTGHPTHRLPNHASFVFRGVDGNNLLSALDMAGFACSSGSACKTGSPEPSEVLTALGYSWEWGLGSLRVTLGSHTRRDQVESFIEVLLDLIPQVRNLTS
jgi:cysteine desulfurase